MKLIAFTKIVLAFTFVSAAIGFIISLMIFEQYGLVIIEMSAFVGALIGTFFAIRIGKKRKLDEYLGNVTKAVEKAERQGRRWF